MPPMSPLIPDRAAVSPRTGASRRAAAVLVGAGAVAGGAMVLHAGAEALFLSRLPATWVPARFLLQAAALAGVGVGLAALRRRVRAERAYVTLLLAVAVGLAGARVALAVAPEAVAPIVAAWTLSATAAAAVVALPGALSADRIAIGAARRLVPVAATSAVTVAAAGLLVFPIARDGDVADLLLVGAALLTLGAAGVAIGAGERAEPRASPAFSAGDVRRFARSRTLGAVALALALGAMATAVADALLAGVLAGLGDPGRIAAFYALFAIATAAFGLAAQLLVAGLHLDRVGGWVALLALPVTSALGFLLVLVAGGSGAIVTLRAAERVLGPSWDATVRSFAAPVTPELRERAAGILTWGVVPLSLAVAGAWLFVAGEAAATVGALLAAAWATAAGLAWWQYLAALVATLRGRRPPDAVSTLSSDDRGVRATIARALRSDEPARIVPALELADALRSRAAFDAEVERLLDHPAELVRLRALRHLGRPGQRAWLAALRRGLDDPSPDVRATAVEVCVAAGGADGVAAVRARLGDADAAVRGAVVVALVGHGGAEGTRLAGDALRAMITDPDPRLRAAAARVLAPLYAPPLRETLLSLLRDADPTVRAAAIDVAGGTGDGALLPRIVAGMEDRRTAAIAAAALARFGHDIERALGDALLDDRRPVSVRAQLARILGRMATPAAAAVLAARLDAVAEPLRDAIAAALARAAQEGVRVDVRRVDEALRAEVDAAWRAEAIRRDVAPALGPGLLDETLAARVARALRRITDLLRARSPRASPALERVRVALEGGGIASPPARCSVTTRRSRSRRGSCRSCFSPTASLRRRPAATPPPVWTSS